MTEYGRCGDTVSFSVYIGRTEHNGGNLGYCLQKGFAYALYYLETILSLIWCKLVIGTAFCQYVSDARR